MSMRTLGSLIGAVGACVAPALQAGTPNSDPFVLDRTFNGGVVIEDRFAATSTSTSQYPARMAVLSNGDIVAAGIVQPAYSSTTAAPTNVGLVRYGSDGSRVPWPSPTPDYSYFYNMYVDYLNSSGEKFVKVRDVVALAGYIYVLADYDAGGGDFDVYVLAFGEDGHFIDIYGAFTTSLHEEGVGLIPYSIPDCGGIIACPMLIAFANYWNPTYPSGKITITTKRFAMGNSGYPAFNPNGTLVVDTTYGPYNNGANDFPAPNWACVQGTGCSAAATAVTAVRTNAVNPTVYVAGYFPDTAGADNTAVLAVEGYSGLLLSDFGDGGYESLEMSPQDSYYVGDRAAAIAATTGGGRAADEVYVVSNVQMYCSSGIGVGKLLGVGGSFDATFGNGGIAYYGGNDDVFCPATYPVTAASAAVIEGNRLVIAGERLTETYPATETQDYEVAIVRTSDGRILDDRTQQLVTSGGTPWGTPPGWADVAGDGNGAFYLVGPLVDPDTGAKLFGTTRIASDRIFAGLFE